MKIKLDENLPALLTDVLSNLGHDVHTSHNEGLSGRPDEEIWAAAQHEGRFMITQDLDFSGVSSPAHTMAFCSCACTHRVSAA